MGEWNHNPFELQAAQMLQNQFPYTLSGQLGSTSGNYNQLIGFGIIGSGPVLSLPQLPYPNTDWLKGRVNEICKYWR